MKKYNEIFIADIILIGLPIIISFYVMITGGSPFVYETAMVILPIVIFLFFLIRLLFLNESKYTIIIIIIFFIISIFTTIGYYNHIKSYSFIKSLNRNSIIVIEDKEISNIYKLFDKAEWKSISSGTGGYYKGKKIFIVNDSITKSFIIMYDDNKKKVILESSLFRYYFYIPNLYKKLTEMKIEFRNE